MPQTASAGYKGLREAQTLILLRKGGIPLANRIKEGDKLPFFRYDTPFRRGERSRALLETKPPLVLVFMSNFGHPVTRTFADRYARTHSALTAGSFALVVRSRPEKLADSLMPDTLPYPLLCDAEGTLYDYLAIPRRSGTLTTYSLEGWNMLRRARREGYRPPKDNTQQLPLTLILAADGTVLFCHYGETLTDVPADCAAMQKLLGALDLAPAGADMPGEPGAETDSFIAAFAHLRAPAPDIPVDVPVETPPAVQDPVPQDVSLDLPLGTASGYRGDSVEFDPPPAFIEPEYQTLGSLTLPDLPTRDTGTKPRKRDRRRPVTRRYAPPHTAPAPQAPPAPAAPPEQDFSALLDELYDNETSPRP